MINQVRKITSRQNPIFKSTLRLRDKKERCAQKKILVEGLRENNQALSHGLTIEALFFCEELLTIEATRLIQKVQESSSVQLFHLEADLIERLLVRETGRGGVCGVYRLPVSPKIDDLVGQDPFLLMVENVEKPGNLGALLRTAEAVGVDAVVLLGSHVDPYSPNVIRSSLGCVFSRPVLTMTGTDARAFCSERDIQVFGAALSNEPVAYGSVSYKGPTAILLGSEDQGLSPFWLKNADQSIVIPMLGSVDSLNLSVAGAVLMYEVFRQRQA